MRLIKNDNILELWEDDKLEAYSFKDEIDFSKLIKHLCNLDFSKKVEFTDEITEKTDAEATLVSVITELINDYNSKVDEYEKFKSQQEQNATD